MKPVPSVLDWWEVEYPHLLAFARSWTHDDEDAEDVVSEAILRTWLAERRGAGVTVSYAFRAIRTICTDLARHRATVNRGVELLRHAATATAPGPDQQLAPDTLDGLNDRQRKIAEAYMRGGRKVEVAADLGISLSGLRQAEDRIQRRLSHARERGAL